MRSTLKRNLRSHGLDGILLIGDEGSANVRYTSGQGSVRGALLIPVRGRPAMLHGPMERDSLPPIEGLRAVCTTDLTASTRTSATKRRRRTTKVQSAATRAASQIAQFLATIGFRGTLGLVGLVEAGYGVEFARVLNRLTKQVTVASTDAASEAFLLSRATKDRGEIELIAEAGRRTQRAVGEAIDFLTSCSIRRRYVVDDRGRRVTSGRLREIILQRLRLEGMEAPESPIVAGGEEAGVPHNIGTDSRALRAGEPIVFDVFPRMISTGYFFDMTRTVCPGTPSPELARMYEQVRRVQRETCKLIHAEAIGADIDAEACRLFESHGHPTTRSAPGTTDGYCHGLGHGLGLQVHELPNLASSWTTPLGEGAVVTVEPGLYYPDRGIGIRIEDVVVVRKNATPRNLCRFSKKFALDLRED